MFFSSVCLLGAIINIVLILVSISQGSIMGVVFNTICGLFCAAGINKEW